MGNHLTRDHFNVEKYTFPYLWKENYPDQTKPSPYDSLEGFPKGRKERVMIATEAEMNSAKLRPGERDYCAHKLIEYKACLKNTRPFPWRCKHQRHAHAECEFEDMVMRMKEWERERRLKERELRAQKQAL